MPKCQQGQWICPPKNTLAFKEKTTKPRYKTTQITTQTTTNHFIQMGEFESSPNLHLQPTKKVQIFC